MSREVKQLQNFISTYWTYCYALKLYWQIHRMANEKHSLGSDELV